MSQFLMAATSEDRSRTSPVTAVVPISSNTCRDPSERARATTVRPWPVRRSTTAFPTTPVPPVTKTRPAFGAGADPQLPVTRPAVNGFEYSRGGHALRRLHSSLGYRRAAEYGATIRHKTAARAAWSTNLLPVRQPGQDRSRQ